MSKNFFRIILSIITIGLLVGCYKQDISIDNNRDKKFISKVATYKTDKKGGAEIVAYDFISKKVFSTNGAENKVDIAQFTYEKSSANLELKRIKSIDLSPYGFGVQSVAVKNGIVAVAVSSKDNTALRGSVVFFNSNGEYIKRVKVGYLPDMVTFSEDGSKIIVANEGEPNKTYSEDPNGSIGIIDIKKDYAYTDLEFYNIKLPKGIVLKPNTPAFKDLEPEYVAISGNKAYVTLQENNALAIVDINSKKIVKVVSLGFKDYSKSNVIDIEEEGEIKLKNYKGLLGMYQPDSIASYKVDSKTYLVTANEGDGREYGDYTNEKKISKLDLAKSIKEDYKNENDLKVNSELGKNKDGKYEKLYAFGARSFSIWDEKGALVFDSGDTISKLIAKYEPSIFNWDGKKIDKRSGNKGGEPEALAVGDIGGNTYAFVGLERQSAILVFDITNPRNVRFIEYYNTKNDDISPEGMVFIPKHKSPTNKPLLLVAYEISGTVSAYELQ